MEHVHQSSQRSFQAGQTAQLHQVTIMDTPPPQTHVVEDKPDLPPTTFKHRSRARIVGWLDIVIWVCYLLFVVTRIILLCVIKSPQPPLLPYSFFKCDQVIFLTLATICPFAGFGTLLVKATNPSPQRAKPIIFAQNNAACYRCATCCAILVTLTVNSAAFLFDWLGSSIAICIVGVRSIFVVIVEPYIKELEKAVNSARKQRQPSRHRDDIAQKKDVSQNSPSTEPHVGGEGIFVDATNNNNLQISPRLDLLEQV